MRDGLCAAASSALETSARSFCHSRNWVARSFGVFAFRIGRRRGEFNFPSRMKNHLAVYDRLAAFYDQYWLPAVWRSLLRIGLTSLLVPNTEFNTNTSRTIQHPAVNRNVISLGRRVIILVATSKPSVGGSPPDDVRRWPIRTALSAKIRTIGTIIEFCCGLATKLVR